jgi:hypothetical protein
MAGSIAGEYFLAIAIISSRFLRPYKNSLRVAATKLRTILDLYGETLKEVGKLVTLNRDDTEWMRSEVRFWQIYWSEFSMVESSGAEDRMMRFGSQLNEYKKTAPTSLC